MADTFDAMKVLGSGACWEVRRADDGRMAVRLTGAIDDDGSNAWRALVEQAAPSDLSVDATGATATTSLTSRAAMAMFVRRLVARGARVDVVANEHMTIVCRTVLRAAGAQQVVLLQPEATAPLMRWR